MLEWDAGVLPPARRTRLRDTNHDGECTLVCGEAMMPDTTSSRARASGAMNGDAGEPARGSVTLGGGRELTLAQVEAVARGGAEVAIAPEARERVRSGRALVERIGAEDRTVYGVTT